MFRFRIIPYDGDENLLFMLVAPANDKREQLNPKQAVKVIIEDQDGKRTEVDGSVRDR